MKPEITYEQFAALDMRVGRVLSVTEPEWSRKLLQLQVDFGADIGTKTILSGIKQWYQASDFEGKLFPFVVNLAERKMGEGVSQGMMMMVDGADRPIPMQIPEESQPGDALA